MIISDERLYGFANTDSGTSIFAAKAQPTDLFDFLSEYINTSTYVPNALGQTINLLPHATLTYIYQTYSSEWTIVAPYYSSYFFSPELWKLLPICSMQMNSAAVVHMDATEDYSCYSLYKDGCLYECITLDSVKYRGYEDFHPESLEKFSMENDVELEPEYYFHNIDVRENLNQFIRSRSSASDITHNFMKRENLYVPSFDMTKQPIVDNQLTMTFEDISSNDFSSFGLFHIRTGVVRG